MQAAESDWEGEGELVYLPALKPSQIATEDQPGALTTPAVVAGVYVADLLRCRSCDAMMVTRQTARNLSKEGRLELRRNGIRRVEVRGVCGGCYDTLRVAGRLDEIALPSESGQFNRSPIEKRFDVPAMWQEIRLADGGYPELGERLGISKEYARQIVIRLGLPRLDRRTLDAEARDEFIKELDRFFSFGMGVHDIAQAFGLSDSELVEKVDRLRARGLTNTRFENYYMSHLEAA